MGVFWMCYSTPTSNHMGVVILHASSKNEAIHKLSTSGLLPPPSALGYAEELHIMGIELYTPEELDEVKELKKMRVYNLMELNRITGKTYTPIPFQEYLVRSGRVC